MGEKILEQENVGIWKQLCHERSLALLQMWGCQGCDSSFLLLTTYLIWYDSTNSQESLIFYVIPSSLGLSNGWNVLVNKSPHLDKVNFIEGNVCVVIHVCPIAVFKPVTDHFNEYLLNVKGSEHPYYALELSWEYLLELFFDCVYWWITSDDRNLTWIDFMNNINCWFYEQYWQLLE